MVRVHTDQCTEFVNTPVTETLAGVASLDANAGGYDPNGTWTSRAVYVGVRKQRATSYLVHANNTM